MENVNAAPVSDSPWKIALSKGQQAAWLNRWPGLFLWVFGIAIVLGFYNVDSVREFFESVGRLKTRFGLWFAMISTAFFGGFLPVMLPIVFGKGRPKLFWSMLLSNVLFWALKGLEVDLLYQFQAWLFGQGTDVRTIASKVFLDIAIYAPLIGLLNCVLFYIWRDNGYSIQRTRKSLGKNWYVRKVLPALISNWFVWLPTVILIYSLPLALQLPVQNLILCFWVLILVFFTAEEDNAT